MSFPHDRLSSWLKYHCLVDIVWQSGQSRSLITKCSKVSRSNRSKVDDIFFSRNLGFNHNITPESSGHQHRWSELLPHHHRYQACCCCLVQVACTIHCCAALVFDATRCLCSRNSGYKSEAGNNIYLFGMEGAAMTNSRLIHCSWIGLLRKQVEKKSGRNLSPSTYFLIQWFIPASTDPLTE